MTTTRLSKNDQAYETLIEQAVTIPPPDFRIAEFRLVGTAPYVQHKFAQKAREQIKATQLAGHTSRKGKKREPRDYQADYLAAQYRLPDERNGIPASNFRNAMIAACRTVGFQMTKAKLGFFIEADGFDPEDGTPLVLIEGKPQLHETYARPETGGADIRVRPMWTPGWQATVRIRYDADMFQLADIANLLSRAGLQVGIGEGRPSSPKSAGLGWGLFTLAEKEL